MRTAQQAPVLPGRMNVPQPPAALYNPTLLSPSVSTEAEQVSKLLTGQPVPTTVSVPPSILPQSLASSQAAVSTLTSATSSLMNQSTPGQMPSIIVNPSPVVVVSPPPTKTKPKKHTSRIHQMFNRIGNRMSQAIPGG